MKVARITDEHKLLIVNQIIEEDDSLFTTPIRSGLISLDTSEFATKGNLTIEKQKIYDGVKFEPVLEPMTNYVLSFQYKKIDGTLDAFGGHNTGFSLSDAYVDGQYRGRFNNQTSVFVADDNNIHTVVVYFTTNTTLPIVDIYIQPNRGSDSYCKVEIYNVKFLEGHDHLPGPFSIDKHKLKVHEFVEGSSIISINGEIIEINELIEMETLDGIMATITIDSSKINEDLADYPVMVKLNELNFDFSKVRTDGKDISFTDMDNNNLSFEMEYFNHTDGLGIFHVKIPFISSSQDTEFRCIYGSGEETDKSNRNDVWSNNYALVHHMGESLIDSTGNGNDITNNNGGVLVDGLNGKARSFNGSSYMEGPWSGFSLIHSISAITKASDSLSTPGIASFVGSNGERQEIYPFTNNQLRQFVWDGTRNKYGVSSINVTWNDDEYHMIAGKYGENDNDLGVVFADGTKGHIYSWSSLGVYDNRFRIGALNFPAGSMLDSYYYIGSIEEIRYSTVSRSDAWIKADNHNLKLNDLITISEGVMS